MNNKKINLNISCECKKCIDRVRIMGSVLDSMSDGVVVFNKKGEFLIFNPAAERILGGKPDNKNPKEWAKQYSIYFPDSDKLYPTESLPIIRALKGDVMNDVEMSLRHPMQSERILVSVSTRPLKDNNGDIWAGLAVFRDVTKKNAQERVLLESENRLRAYTEELEKTNFYMEWERAKYEALLDSIGGGLIAVDEEGNIIKINKSGEEALGLKACDVEGTSILDAFSLEDEQGTGVQVEKLPVIQALSKGRRVDASYYYVCKNGKRFPAYTISTPVCFDKKIIGSITVFYNIAREIEIDKAKSEFVALASHQLRTPLSTIRWYTKALLDGEFIGLKSRSKRYVQEIYHANRRMIELVDCLLNVSRIELGTFAIEPQPIELKNIASEVITELRSRIKAKKLTLAKKFRKNVPVIDADPNLIRIVFQNLLSNAVKYTPRRGHIDVCIQKQKNDVLIAVRDNGYGIPKLQQQKIFTKLFRADNAQELEADGTGLGLYIAKSIIDKSRGKIWFESNEGSGTVFYVTIPLAGMQKKAGNKKLNPFHLYSGSTKGQLQETILHTQHESVY